MCQHAYTQPLRAIPGTHSYYKLEIQLLHKCRMCSYYFLMYILQLSFRKTSLQAAFEFTLEMYTIEYSARVFLNFLYKIISRKKTQVAAYAYVWGI